MDRPLTAGDDPLERVLRSYEAYYTVSREASPPFAARAVFHAHGEGYFLTRRAKFAELDSHEYAFFARVPVLTPEGVRDLARRAWEEGLAGIDPAPNHRASDVLLLILTDDLTPEAEKALRRTRLARSYRLGLRGYSHLRLAAMEPATLRAAANPMGAGLVKHLRAVLKG